MKTAFHRNKNRSKKRLVVLGIAVALVFFIFFNNSARSFATGIILKIFRAVFILRAGKTNEQPGLAEKVNELEAEISRCQIIEKENDDLRRSLGRTDKPEYLLGYILSRPPQSPYDILILDVGSKNGVKEGDEVTAYGDILLGYAREVFENTSRVKLISFPKEETNAMLLSLNIPVIVAGAGGANMEITLTKSVEIKTGEKVVALGAEPLLMGIAERIQSEESDPYQKIFLRLPVNLQELKYVMIKR